MTPTQLDEDRTQAALDSREGCCGEYSQAVQVSGAEAIIRGVIYSLAIYGLFALAWKVFA